MNFTVKHSSNIHMVLGNYIDLFYQIRVGYHFGVTFRVNVIGFYQLSYIIFFGVRTNDLHYLVKMILLVKML